jgi:hypothetical protein
VRGHKITQTLHVTATVNELGEWVGGCGRWGVGESKVVERVHHRVGQVPDHTDALLTIVNKCK